MIKVTCAWCGKGLGEKQGESEGETHGICDNCVRLYFPRYYDKIKKGNAEVTHGS